MRILETNIPGCFEIFPKIAIDDRGMFVKTFHYDIFLQYQLETNWREEYYSISRKGVLRGMHFQTPPHDHNKLVYCTAGKVLDAVVDMRSGSPAYGQHLLTEICSEKGNMLYIPKGLAHGFYTLSESATMMYKVSSVYAPSHDSGILWSSVGILWSDMQPILSVRDKSLPEFSTFSSAHFSYK